MNGPEEIIVLYFVKVSVFYLLINVSPVVPCPFLDNQETTCQFHLYLNAHINVIKFKKLCIVALNHIFLCFSYQPGHSVGMLAAVEHGPILCSDSNILCLSWKGRVPKSEKDKPVCRRRYYEEGWLATGNGRGVVGVTFTSSHCRRDRSTPQRINFNLRGHNSEVWSLLWRRYCHHKFTRVMCIVKNIDPF